MKKIVTSIFILFVFSGNNFAQNHGWCGAKYTPQAAQWREDNAYLNKLVNHNSRTTYFIPVRFHLFGADNGTGYFSRNNLLSIMDKLNKDYASVGFVFYIAGTNGYITKDNDVDRIPNNYFYNGYYDTVPWNWGDPDPREALFVYNTPNVFNVYIMNQVTGICGRANFPGDVNGVADGGIELIKNCLTSYNSTFTHEAGHWFSLPHPFSSWESVGTTWSCPNISSICSPSTLTCWPSSSQWSSGVEYVNSQPLGNSTSKYNCEKRGDGFCDTPPDYYFDRWGSSGSCPNACSTWKDPDGVAINPDASLFMAYSDDKCATRFSNEQINGNSKKSGMIATLLSPARAFLLALTPPSQVAITGTEQFIVPFQNDTIPYHKFQFSWSYVPGATMYHFQLSRSISWAESSTKVDIFTSNNFYTISLADQLIAGQKYYWRVKPFNPTEYGVDYAKEGSAFYRIVYAADSTFINTTDSAYIFPLGLTTITERKNIRIYPNPSRNNGNINVEFFTDKEMTATSKLFDISGRLLKINPLIFSPNKTVNEINLEDLTPGIYLIKVTSSGFSYEDKIVVVY